MWEITGKLDLETPKGLYRLSQKKYYIVDLLIERKGQVVSYSELIEYAELASKHSLQNHIKKLKDDFEFLGIDFPILPITGQGYMWKE